MLIIRPVELGLQVRTPVVLSSSISLRCSKSMRSADSRRDHAGQLRRGDRSALAGHGNGFHLRVSATTDGYSEAKLVR